MSVRGLTLIGMPGAGKSTVGAMLANKIGTRFIDTDLLLSESLGESLQGFLDKKGYRQLRRKEEHIILNSNLNDAVVATGGSVVYSDVAMAKLKGLGPLIYLRANFSTIKNRVVNFSTRGIACAPGTTLVQLYEERLLLYQQYADFTVDSDDAEPEKLVERILRLIN